MKEQVIQTGGAVGLDTILMTSDAQNVPHGLVTRHGSYPGGDVLRARCPACLANLFFFIDFDLDQPLNGLRVQQDATYVMLYS